MLVRPTKGSQRFEQLFEESFNRFFDSLHRYAYTFLKDRERATDIVQTVFTKWWETKTMVGDADEARKYLFTAVYRSSLNGIRNEKAKHLHVAAYVQEQETELKFHDSVAFEELDTKIKLGIASLPAQCRIIFCKSRFDEKKYAEIAADMNLSVKTVEVQMGKALRILRERVGAN